MSDALLLVKDVEVSKAHISPKGENREKYEATESKVNLWKESPVSALRHLMAFFADSLGTLRANNEEKNRFHVPNYKRCPSLFRNPFMTGVLLFQSVIFNYHGIMCSRKKAHKIINILIWVMHTCKIERTFQSLISPVSHLTPRGGGIPWQSYFRCKT